MLPNTKLSEQVSVLDVFAPVSQAAATVNTPNWIYVGNLQQLQALIHAGVLGASATLDAKVRQAQDSSGTGAKDITGKAITQLTQAGSGSGKLATIDFRPQDLDTNNGFCYVQISMTVGVAASLISAELVGSARFEAATAYDAAAVAQRV
jgi:hypothetical protein